MLAKVLMAFGRKPAAPEPRGRVWVVPETGWRTLLDPESMAGFASICPPRPYRKGEAIYRPGDPAESLFILLEGRVKISLPSPAGERVVAVVGPDDFFRGVLPHSGPRAKERSGVHQQAGRRLPGEP